MQKRRAWAAAIFIMLAIVMTWPLAPRLTHAVSDPSDPFINIWILDWDHYATFHRPLTLFDANIFYPAHDTLAFSENLYGIALPLIPVRAAGASPVTAYNLAMLAGFAFSGFAAFLLGDRLTGSFAASVAAGIFHAFVPFRFTHLPHLQHVFAGWLPLLLVALLGYIDRPSWRSASLFGFVFLMNGLTNIHWFFFGSFAIGATILLFLVNGVRRWRELIIASAVAMLLLLPFLIPYWRVAKTGLARDRGETKAYSATLGDWLVSSDASRFYPALRDRSVNPERWLFPGVLSILAALAALFLARRYPRGVTLGLLWLLIGLLGSLGLNFYFHDFLFDAVPGFRGIRVPARWAEIAYIGLAMLIAVTVAFVARRKRWIAAAIPLLFLVELRAAPIRWWRAPLDVPPVYRWLATQNVRAVVELPIDTDLNEYLYEYRSVSHHRDLVNGVSGAVPAQFIRFSGMFQSDPIPDAFRDELRRTGVDLAIVHADMLGPRDATTRAWLRRELERGRLSFVRRFAAGASGDWVFAVRAPGGQAILPVASPELQAFLDGKALFTPWTFGSFNRPPAQVRGDAFFSGIALSPFGVRGVDLLFDGGGVRIPATLIADAKVEAVFSFYGASTPKPRFVASFRDRPDGVPLETDVQAEITDGKGEKTRLQFYWMKWESPRSTAHENH